MSLTPSAFTPEEPPWGDFSGGSVLEYRFETTRASLAAAVAGRALGSPVPTLALRIASSVPHNCQWAGAGVDFRHVGVAWYSVSRARKTSYRVAVHCCRDHESFGRACGWKMYHAQSAGWEDFRSYFGWSTRLAVHTGMVVHELQDVVCHKRPVGRPLRGVVAALADRVADDDDLPRFWYALETVTLAAVAYRPRYADVDRLLGGGSLDDAYDLLTASADRAKGGLGTAVRSVLDELVREKAETVGRTAIL